MLQADMLEIAQEHHAIYYLQQIRRLNEDYKKATDKRPVLDRFQTLWEQIYHAQLWVMQNSQSRQLAQLCHDYVGAAKDLLLASYPFSETLSWLQDSLRVAIQWQDIKHQVKALIDIGEIELFHGGEPTKRFEEAIALSKAFGYLECEASARIGLGRAQFTTPQLAPNVLDNFMQAREILSTLDLPEVYAYLVQNLGMYEARYGDIEAALDYQQQALKLFQDMNDKRQVAVTLKKLAGIAERQGNISQASQLAVQALSVARTAGDNRTMMSCLTSLGLIVSIQADLVTSRKYFLEALDLSKQTGDQNYQTNCLLNLGWLAKHQRQYADAIDYQEQVIDLAQATRNLYMASAGHVQLAEVYIDTWVHDKVKIHLNASCKLADTIEASDLLVSAMLLLSKLCYREGNSERSGQLMGATLAQPESSDPLLSDLIEQLQTNLQSTYPDMPQRENILQTGKSLGYKFFVEQFISQS